MKVDFFFPNQFQSLMMINYREKRLCCRPSASERRDEPAGNIWRGSCPNPTMGRTCQLHHRRPGCPVGCLRSRRRRRRHRHRHRRRRRLHRRRLHRRRLLRWSRLRCCRPSDAMRPARTTSADQLRSFPWRTIEVMQGNQYANLSSTLVFCRLLGAGSKTVTLDGRRKGGGKREIIRTIHWWIAITTEMSNNNNR